MKKQERISPEKWVNLPYEAQLYLEMLMFSRELGIEYPLFTTRDRGIFRIYPN